MLRKLLFLLVVLPTAGMAYAWFADLLPEAKAKVVSLWKGAQSGPGSGGLNLRDVLKKAPSSQLSDSALEITPQLTGVPVAEPSEVLRFDVQPAWVTSRWSRVSAVLSEQQFQGLRVPLVTGTDLDDLAGSLTYYFDQRRQVRRVTFTGRTGDPEELVRLVTQRFGFQAVPDLGAGIYVVRWNGQPMSVLRVEHASVIRSTDPLSRFDIELEVNRPDLGYQLSPRFQQIVARDRAVRRW